MAKEMTASYASACRACPVGIKPGDVILYDRAVGSRHKVCPAATAQAPVAASIRVSLESESRPASGSHVGRVLRLGRRAGSNAGKVVVVVSQSAHYYREDGLSFGLSDDRGWLLTLSCREANAGEVAKLEVTEAAEKDQREEAERLRQERRDVANLFIVTGERPEGTFSLEGDEISDGASRAHGGGTWYVIEGPAAPAPRSIWYVINNGADGDCWSLNNVRTGGAGAVGRRLPWSVELEARVRALVPVEAP